MSGTVPAFACSATDAHKKGRLRGLLHDFVSNEPDGTQR